MEKLSAAAEGNGGIEFYLIDHELGDYPQMVMAERCLAEFHKMMYA